ncbi:zinc-binding dehydrogenase [Streptomyces sp. NPDC005548]|uniref:zinc-binding dehydrogenase n=1 Tax=Streptomyces sp. NPDC005548 TaxID=3364724 RepID=UPI0036C0CE2C
MRARPLCVRAGTGEEGAGEHLLAAVADSRARPLIDSTLSFDTAAEAAQRLRSHQEHGKIILTVP